MEQPLGVWTAGARLVTGAAGSGKTTALVGRYVELVRAEQQGILMLVPGRRAARAAADRILRELGTATDQVVVTTWHAFALSLVREHHAALRFTREPGLLNGPEQFALVREMLESEEERSHWVSFPKQLRLVGFAEELREFVLRAQDALESPEHLAERAHLARRPALAEAAGFFRRYLDQLNDRHLVDHANVIALAVALMQDHPEIAGQVRTGTGHLLVDEYQDVTPAQEVLLRRLFVDGGSVMAAADPDARVFGFRGSSESAVDGFLEAFAPGAHHEELTVRRRPQPAREAWLFDHLTEEADAIAREARRVHQRESVGWGDIAVIVRRDGAVARAIRRAFERAEVPYVVVGENRPLRDEPALVPMLELARAALRPDQLDDALPRLLSSPVVGLDPYDVRALRREARLRETTLAGFVAAPPADLPERLVGPLTELRALLEEIRERDATEKRADGVFWFLWDRLSSFRTMVERGDDAELDAVAAFARAIERFSDKRDGARFADYLEVIDVPFGPEPWRMPEERRPDAVRILTAHHAVGTEFAVVFVAGCVEGEFPDPRDARALVDMRDLLAPATPVERERARLAEEKRLFGVATSRARHRLILTCARESSQREALTPTPFLTMVCDAWGAPARPEEALTRAEAEARLRRIARNTTLPDEQRREAIDGLARLPGIDPGTWWYQRDWTDTGSPLISGEFLTSYSRLSHFENCGLQYLFQVELGLDPEQTHNMLVGSWVHDIVDRCARGEIPAEADALLAELDRVWVPGIFPSRAIEHRYHISCAQMLERWLSADGKTRPLATEVEFRFPLGGATIRGYIDRVVRCGTKSVRLTDYKTGSSDKSEQQVKEDLQLATYYLAMRRDPDLASFGEPMVLELGFLARPDGRYGYKKPSFDPRRVEGFEENTAQRLVALIDGVRSEEFAPKPDADCQWCKFKTLCPVWPQGDEVPL